VVTLPSAQVAKRGGARTLVTTTDLRIALQTVGLCGRNERIANSPELMTRLARGRVDGIVHILDPRNKREVTAVLKKHLRRLSADEDAETSYHSLRTIVSLDIAPDLPAFKKRAENCRAGQPQNCPGRRQRSDQPERREDTGRQRLLGRGKKKSCACALGILCRNNTNHSDVMLS
jgi:hypothetical protein